MIITPEIRTGDDVFITFHPSAETDKVVWYMESGPAMNL